MVYVDRSQKLRSPERTEAVIGFKNGVRALVECGSNAPDLPGETIDAMCFRAEVLGTEGRALALLNQRGKCKNLSKAVRNPDGTIKYWKPSRRWKQFNTVLMKLYAKRREELKLFAYTVAHWLERHYDKVLYGDYTPFAGLKNTHRSMLSQGYVGYLRGIVKWVFEKSGKVAEEVSERKSTKTCHCCGKEMDMPPEERFFVCSNPECNASLPRDANSAINLYNWHHLSDRKIPDAKISLHLKWSPFFGLEEIYYVT